MIRTRLLLDYNIYILATYGDKLSYEEYYQLIQTRFFAKDNHTFYKEFYDDIDKHHNEFYIHHSTLYEHFILDNPKITLPKLVTFLESMFLEEGVHYIIVDKNANLKNGPFENVITVTPESKISDFVKVQNWRVFNQRRILSIINKKREYKIKKLFQIFQSETHIMLTPRGFYKIAMAKTETGERDELIDYYINYRFVTFGYINYVKLGKQANEHRVSFNNVIQTDGNYNEFKRIDSISNFEYGSDSSNMFISENDTKK